MELRKRLDENTVIAAGYLIGGGLSLRMNRKGDKYNNAVAFFEMVDGEPVLTLLRDTLDRYGIKVVESTIEPDEW